MPSSFFVENLQAPIVTSFRDIFDLIDQGTARHKTSATLMSSVSSRPHAIFMVKVQLFFSYSGGCLRPPAFADRGSRSIQGFPFAGWPYRVVDIPGLLCFITSSVIKTTTCTSCMWLAQKIDGAAELSPEDHS